jgi:hypothetical protein
MPNVCQMYWPKARVVLSVLEEVLLPMMNNAKHKDDGSKEPHLIGMNEGVSPYKSSVWRKLTPAERLHRSWALCARLPDPQAVHDRKLFQSLLILPPCRQEQAVMHFDDAGHGPSNLFGAIFGNL